MKKFFILFMLCFLIIAPYAISQSIGIGTSIPNASSLIDITSTNKGLEAAAKQLGFDFSGVDVPKNENDTYGLRYAEFVVPLVKAVQELSNKNDELKKQNETLLNRIEKLESLIAAKK